MIAAQCTRMGSGRRNPRRSVSKGSPGPAQHPTGMGWVLGAEALASALGFVVMIRLARGLGPSSFAHFEFASAVAAWLLVLVRGGVDVIIYREAARRPSLIGPLTEVLVGLRLLAALGGYGLILVLASLAGGSRGVVLAMAGLVLFPSALAFDAGIRAKGRLGWVALGQTLRVFAYMALVFRLVHGPADEIRAAACLVLCECVASLVSGAWHVRVIGWPRLRIRKRASWVIAVRGAIAGLTRFGRVTLYGIDLLVLGWVSGADVGPYAAARRLVFGLVAFGLVVPASLAPTIAARWACDAEATRHLIETSLLKLWLASLVSLCLLVPMSNWVMPALFGQGYAQGGPLLALVALRLPWLLTASFIQAALVACRRESWVLRQMAWLVALAAVVVPLATWIGGPWGAGIALLLVEVLAALGGWKLLVDLGLRPRPRIRLGLRPLGGEVS